MAVPERFKRQSLVTTDSSAVKCKSYRKKETATGPMWKKRHISEGHYM